MQLLHRFLHVLAHFVDDRDNIRMISVHLPNILTVLGHYTAYPHLELRHEMCRHVVNVLVWMAGRMNGNYMDKFAIFPYTIRDDESALCDLLDRTVGNEAQFQVSETVRIQASCVINKYLEQIKVDELKWDPINDVQNLVLWVEAGMFMSLVPLTPDTCYCPSCRSRVVYAPQ